MQITTQPSVIAPESAITRPRVNWLHVGWFLGLTFGLTWLLDLVLYWNGGLASPAVGLLLQFQMLLPAFSAMVLGVFFFKENPIHYRSNRTASRWFVYYYFLFTFLYLIGVIVGLIHPTQTPIISSFLALPSLIGLFLLVVLRLKKGGREAFACPMTGIYMKKHTPVFHYRGSVIYTTRERRLRSARRYSRKRSLPPARS